jgi:hypothetical protein
MLNHYLLSLVFSIVALFGCTAGPRNERIAQITPPSLETLPPVNSAPAATLVSSSTQFEIPSREEPPPDTPTLPESQAAEMESPDSSSAFRLLDLPADERGEILFLPV